MKKTGVRVTSFDVAALAGVSQSAVSRAFTPGTRISEATRKKVLEAAHKLKYVPNSIASSLTTNRSNIVALILGSLENPFYVQVFQEFSQRLQERGLQTLTFNDGGNGDTDEAIRRVLRYQIDAVVFTSAQLSTRMISLCQDRGIPVALFNRYLPMSDVPGVRCDNQTGGRLLAEEFLAAGARSFLLITGDPRGTTSQDRVRGFTERLLEAGIRRSDIRSLPGLSSYAGGAAAIRTLAEKGDPMPDAVFGINDIMAMGAIDALRFDLGKRIPDDVMVAGFDGIPEAGRLNYRLTTARQPLEAMVNQTLRLLGLAEADRDGVPAGDAPLPVDLLRRDTIRLATKPV